MWFLCMWFDVYVLIMMLFFSVIWYLLFGSILLMILFSFSSFFFVKLIFLDKVIDCGWWLFGVDFCKWDGGW